MYDLEVYDDGVDYFEFPECKNDKHEDDHWFLRPLCQECGRPEGDYPHNEYGLRDAQANTTPEGAESWHPLVPPTGPLVWGENAWRGNDCHGYHDNSWKPIDPDTGERPRSESCSCRCHWGTYYVNVYEIDRGYGGPEEGGWWYDSGTPVAAVPFDTLREAEDFAEVMRARFPHNHSSSSVAYRGGDFGVRIERRFAAPYPEHTPRYS